MNIDFLETFGQIAGIGGLALVTFLILFHDVIGKRIFPMLKKDDAYRLLRLIVILVSIITVIGLGAWVWSENYPKSATSVQAIHGVAAGRDISKNTIIINGKMNDAKESSE